MVKKGKNKKKTKNVKLTPLLEEKKERGKKEVSKVLKFVDHSTPRRFNQLG